MADTKHSEDTSINSDEFKIQSYQFWAKFAEQLKGGDPVETAVLAAIDVLDSGAFMQACASLKKDVQAGTPLYTAMEKHPDFFSKGVVGLIKTGIANKKLPEMASNVASGLAGVASRAGMRKNSVESDIVRETQARERFESRRARIEQKLQAILEAAIHENASHVHLEPLVSGARVMFRKTGLMVHHSDVAQEDYESLLFALKKMSKLFFLGAIYPQYGQMFTRVDDRQIDIVITFSLYHYGENAVLRLFDRGRELPTLNGVSLDDEQKAELLRWAESDSGIVLFAGPGSCGKSTTLFAWLESMQGKNLKLCTIEKNLQYLFPEVNHIRVKQEVNMDYVEAIQMQAEQDLDVLVVDEIRNDSIAKAMVDCATLGVLLGSTIQAGGAPEALYRFCEFGIEPFRIHDLVLGSVSQRLVRKICDNCKDKHVLSDNEKRILKQMGISLKKPVYSGRGCKHCAKSGYSGALAFFEVLPMTNEIAAAIRLKEGSRKVRMAAQSSSFYDLKQSGLARLQSGDISPEEFIRSTNSVYLMN